ncbi:MAG TPA: histidine kinase [Burkholderiales bacterium]|nr:histidine kinase [Burkholderiales bacterium]
MYRRYAEWLVSISWKRFIVLAIVLMIVAGVLSGLPPFSWTIAERTVQRQSKLNPRDVDVTMDEHGIHIRRKASGSTPAREITIDDEGIQMRAVEEAKREAERDTKPGSSLRDDVQRNVVAPLADSIRREIATNIRDEIDDAITELGARDRVVRVRLGEFLPQLAFLFILLSAAIKIAYARTVKAEAQAAEAHHVAEEEGLKRQLAEARMAAMQAQIEPHFLFNTLASIDHLIETDPPRASQMQKNLIALLRASMPAMRDRATNLGRELEVVRPYLEILKVRMGERLQAQLNVPEGLYSADFPPMMLQSLVENAIKHGLEPKADGGALTVSAEVVHGKLAVSVADTGVGFGRAATAGTGMGLQNIRERLKLIYGEAAELRIADNTPSGTRASIVVPYKAT